MCQYLYVCTSNASKMGNLRALSQALPCSESDEGAHMCQNLYICTSKASKLIDRISSFLALRVTRGRLCQYFNLCTSKASKADKLST